METFGLVLAELPGGTELVMDPVHRHDHERRPRARRPAGPGARPVRSEPAVTLARCSLAAHAGDRHRLPPPRPPPARRRDAVASAGRVALITLVLAAALRALPAPPALSSPADAGDPLHPNGPRGALGRPRPRPGRPRRPPLRRRAPCGDRVARRPGLLPLGAGDLRPAPRRGPGGRHRERLPRARPAGEPGAGAAPGPGRRRGPLRARHARRRAPPPRRLRRLRRGACPSRTRRWSGPSRPPPGGPSSRSTATTWSSGAAAATAARAEPVAGRPQSMPARVRTGTPCARASAAAVPARVALLDPGRVDAGLDQPLAQLPSRAWRKNSTMIAPNASRQCSTIITVPAFAWSSSGSKPQAAAAAACPS